MNERPEWSQGDGTSSDSSTQTPPYGDLESDPEDACCWRDLELLAVSKTGTEEGLDDMNRGDGLTDN